jgi:hypothetical protein
LGSRYLPSHWQTPGKLIGDFTQPQDVNAK